MKEEDLAPLSEDQITALIDAEMIDLTDDELKELKEAKVPKSIVSLADKIINVGINKVSFKSKAEALNGIDAILKQHGSKILGDDEFAKLEKQFGNKTGQKASRIFEATLKKLEAKQTAAEAQGNDNQAEALQAKIDEMTEQMEAFKTQKETELSDKDKSVRIERKLDKLFTKAMRSNVFTETELAGKHTETNFLSDVSDSMKALKVKIDPETGELVGENGKAPLSGGKPVTYDMVIEKAKTDGGWGAKSDVRKSAEVSVKGEKGEGSSNAFNRTFKGA